MSTSKNTLVYADNLPVLKAIVYPPHLRAQVEGRARQRLGEAVGMRNFGVNLTSLEPGAWSSHRHWHTRQDEMIYLLEGELTLVTDNGRQILKPGAVVGFPANSGEGHHLINEGTSRAVYLEIGDRLPGDEAVYPDVDLLGVQKSPSYQFTRKDASSF